MTGQSARRWDVGRIPKGWLTVLRATSKLKSCRSGVRDGARLLWPVEVFVLDCARRGHRCDVDKETSLFSTRLTPFPRPTLDGRTLPYELCHLLSQDEPLPSSNPPPSTAVCLPTPHADAPDSMTSDKARTALGAGASLALRPTPTAGSYFSSHSDLGSLGDSAASDATGRTRSYNIEEDGVIPAKPPAAAAATGEAGDGSGTGSVSGDGGDGAYSLFGFASGVLGGSASGKGWSGRAGAAEAGGRGSSGAGGGGDARDMPPPPPRPPSKEAAKEGGDAQAAAAAAAARFPDPFQQQQQQQQQPRRLSGLPENEEVVPESPRPSLEAAKQVMTRQAALEEVCSLGVFCLCSLAGIFFFPRRVTPFQTRALCLVDSRILC